MPFFPAIFSPQIRLIGALCVLVLLLSCRASAPARNSPGAFTDQDKASILAALKTQETCWNRADIACFMEYYWKSDSLTFTGSSGINRGWQATYDRYVRSYPDAATMGQLRFDILEFQVLAADAVHLIGKWNLERSMGNIGGYFTLIWRKIDGRWLIVADHTS